MDDIIIPLLYLEGVLLLLFWCCVFVYVPKTWADRVYFLLTTACVGFVVFSFLKG